MSIILRSTKGSALTYGEMDNNFAYLSSSYATTSSNSFLGDQLFFGNITVYGTASFSSITSSATNISSSEFGVTIASPLIRYGYYNVYDSLAPTLTSSLVYDSVPKRWVYRDVVGSTVNSSVLLTGPKSTGGLGTENYLSQYRIPVANGDQSLSDSLIFSSGSTTTVSGSMWTTNDIIVGGTASSNGPGFGRFLAISGSYPGIILDNDAVGKTYSFGNGAFSQFFISDDTVGATRFVIESNGWIGLGKSPATFFDVNGNTFISGTLDVTGNIAGTLIGTASYAINALLASTASISTTSSFALTSISASSAATASYVKNAVSASVATSASYVLNAVSSSFANTASYVLNAVSSSFASTAAAVNPLSQSVALTGSLNIRNTAARTAMTVLGRSGSLYIDLNGVGNNYMDGNVLYLRNAAGSSTFATFAPSITSINSTSTSLGGSVNITGATTLSGSLTVRKADGNNILYITSSVSSSTSTIITGTTASFNGNITFTPSGVSNCTWNTDLDIYYSGISGSAHTNLSPVSQQLQDNQLYDMFNISLNDGITLTPNGVIPSDKYVIWIYASGSINKWFQKTDNDIFTLQSPGLDINLTPGATNDNLENDLIFAGFAAVSDPNPYNNNITTTTTSTTSVTASLFDVNSNANFTGSVNITGSLVFNGNKQFNYGAFYDTASHTLTSGTPYTQSYNTTSEAFGVSISNNTRVTVENSGVYNIQFSTQFAQSSADRIVDVWFKKNGTAIPASNTKVSTRNGDYQPASWNIVTSLSSNDYIELMYQTNGTGTSIPYVAASGAVPATPSVILTVTQIR